MPSPHTTINAIHITTSSLPWWTTLLLVAAAIFAAVWFYRDTTPPVAGWRRMAFTALRALALLLIVLGAIEPVLTVTVTERRQPVTVVLVDQSTSMADAIDPRRSNDARSALEALREGMPGPVTVLGFDAGVHSIESSEPAFNGQGTDIASAIEKAAKIPDVAAIMLVSDGRWNLGIDPVFSVKSLEIPVHTVTVGSPALAFDASIGDVSVSPVGRAGTTMPVDILVSATGPVADAIPVAIRENGAEIASGIIAPGSGLKTLLTIQLPLHGAGVHRYEVVINPSNDAIPSNNTRGFEVFARKNRYAVLLAAYAPSPDLAFLRRTIEADSSFTLDIAMGVATGTGILKEIPASLGACDAIMVLDGAGSLLTAEAATRIRDRVAAGCGLWMLGSTPPGAVGESLTSLLPLRFSGAAAPDTLYSIAQSTAGKTHFLTAGSDGDQSIWGSLPPLRAIHSCIPANQGGAVLLEAASGTAAKSPRYPVMAAGAIGMGRTLVMPVSGFWRWSLMMTGAGKESAFFERFVVNALNWMTSETSASSLTVSTGALDYLNGQTVRFEARLFDTVYTPVAGAGITLTLDGDPSTRIVFDETSPAIYAAGKPGIGPGVHTYEASASRDGAPFASAKGSFTVQNYSLEQINTASDHAVMSAIAASSGGLAVTAAGVDSILSRIPTDAITSRRDREYRPSFFAVLPFAALLLLGIEWAARKYRGMI